MGEMILEEFTDLDEVGAGYLGQQLGELAIQELVENGTIIGQDDWAKATQAKHKRFMTRCDETCKSKKGETE
jgi:hypothetical protein